MFTRLIACTMLVLLLGFGFDWWIMMWRWWAVAIPTAVFLATVGVIEDELSHRF